MDVQKFIKNPSELNVRWGHHRSVKKKDFDVDNLFTPIKNRDRTGLDNERLRRALSIYINKPENGTGLWVSDIVETDKGINTNWYIHGPVKVRRSFVEIIPDEDCKIFVVDSIEALTAIEVYYNFDFEKMSEDFDVLYLVEPEFFLASFIYRQGDLQGFYGWDVVSALFLNKKFTVGESYKAKGGD